MVQARASQGRAARVSTLRLKAHPRDAAALEWRESKSSITAFGPFNDRAAVGHVFSRATRHARGSREANRECAISQS